MKIDDKFDSKLAWMAKPSGKNALNILGDSAVGYSKMREDDEIKDIKMDEIKKKVADNKTFAKYEEHLHNGGNRRSFLADGNSFLTPDGAMNAEKLDRSRAAQRMAEGRYGLAVKRANAPKKKKIVSAVASGISNLNALNSSLSGATTKTTKPKTVTVFKDGKPITYTVGG